MPRSGGFPWHFGCGVGPLEFPISPGSDKPVDGFNFDLMLNLPVATRSHKVHTWTDLMLERQPSNLIGNLSAAVLCRTTSQPEQSSMAARLCLPIVHGEGTMCGSLRTGLELDAPTMT